MIVVLDRRCDLDGVQPLRAREGVALDCVPEARGIEQRGNPVRVLSLQQAHEIVATPTWSPCRRGRVDVASSASGMRCSLPLAGRDDSSFHRDHSASMHFSRHGARVVAIIPRKGRCCRQLDVRLTSIHTEHTNTCSRTLCTPAPRRLARVTDPRHSRGLCRRGPLKGASPRRTKNGATPMRSPRARRQSRTSDASKLATPRPHDEVQTPEDVKPLLPPRQSRGDLPTD